MAQTKAAYILFFVCNLAAANKVDFIPIEKQISRNLILV